MFSALKKATAFVMLSVWCLLSAGCATIVHGTSQDVEITSSPRGAAVTVDSEPYGNTPVVVTMKRGGDHTVRMDLPGHEPYTTRIARKASGWGWGNFIFLGGWLIGLAIDFFDGALYNLLPGDIDATLVKTGGVEAAPAPQEAPPPVAPAEIEKNLPWTSMKNRDAIAVVIGNTDYRKAKPVAYAINDARTMKRYLVEVMGYQEGNVFMEEDASKGVFELYFGVKGNHKGKLFNSVKPGESDVFVYYSGHGAPGLKDHRGYFVPVEADPQYIELGGYALDVFYENLSKIKPRSMTVVLDSCFSGADVFENISPITIEVQNPVAKLRDGIVITSSRGNQVSSWYNEKGHGMLTYFFIKAIHSRNADSNGDSKITFDELYTYISDPSEGVPYQARRLHGVDQTPTIEGNYKGRVFVRY